MGKAELGPSADPKPLNRSLPNLNHVITSRTSTATKIGLNPFRVFFSPYTRNIHPQTFECLAFFGSSLAYLRGHWTDFDAQYVIRCGSAQGSAF